MLQVEYLGLAISFVPLSLSSPIFCRFWSVLLAAVLLLAVFMCFVVVIVVALLYAVLLWSASSPNEMGHSRSPLYYYYYYFQLTIAAPFWLVNKSGLPVVFRQDSSDSEAAGQFDEHERARSITPLLFSFSDHDEPNLWVTHQLVCIHSILQGCPCRAYFSGVQCICMQSGLLCKGHWRHPLHVQTE